MNIFKTLRRGCGMLAVAAVAACLSFQSYAAVPDGLRKVSGTVVDETGLAVIGAILFVENATDYNTMTDENGAFSFEVPAGSTITVNCIGYITYNFTADGKASYDIKIMSDMQNLEESVVVGYGTQKKANLTGAITNIGEKAIQATTSNELTSKLQGKVSGLNIRNNTGTPGSYDTSINIRGFGTPLFVIDGVERQAADFHRLNAEDIESVSVLKDASAAIYGLNAANGVIIVTTKNGSKSGNAHFQFNANVGFSSPTDQVKMADGYQYYYLRQSANTNAGDATVFIDPSELAKWQDGTYQSTDWYGETLKDFSLRQQYSISADGGSEKVQYYFNIAYMSDDGLLKSNDINYKKWSFRSNIKAKLTDAFTASVNISGYSDEQNSPSSGFTAVWRGIVNCLPYKSVYANNNTQYYNSVKDGQSYNPVALSYTDNVGYSTNTKNSLNATFDLVWNPTFLRDLEIKGLVAYDKRWERAKTVSKAFSMYSYDDVTGEYVEDPYNSTPKISQGYYNTRYLTTQIQASYKHTWVDAHNFSAAFIWETRKSDYDYNSIYKEYDFFSNDQIDYAEDNENTSTAGNETQTRNMSFIGRVTYDYLGRYLIEVAARYDGSYRYAPEQRWGLFPVVSAGWRISEERWMKNSSAWLSNLKIRGSVGQIGEDTGNAFQYISAFTLGGGWWDFNNTSGAVTKGVATPALVNTNMTWTVSNIYDAGLDFGFFDNRLTGAFDYFLKDKEGILAYKNVSVPNTFGATFPQENLNSNRTQGVEFSLGWQDRAGDFFYSVSGNATYARTMNMYIESSDPTSSWNKYSGYSNYRWSDLAWVYNVVGQFQTQEEIDNYAVYSTSTGMKYVCPGDWKYEDVNGDGVIDDDDKRPLVLSNNGSPLWNYGLTLTGAWRGLDVNILFQGAAGFYIHRDLTYTTPFWQEANIPAWYMDSWHHEDIYDSSSPWVAGELPSVRVNTESPYLNQYASTKSYMNCTYVRLKNVEIGYTFSQKWIKKAHIDKLRLFVSATNLLTICDKYVKAFDPEVVSQLTGGAYTGWEYPLCRTFNVGLNLNF